MRDLLAEWAPSGTQGSLRLAVRNGYLNFYRFGQSVAKVDFPARRETATATVHHKYVVPRAQGQEYLKIEAGQGRDHTGKCTREWGGPAMLGSWIGKATCHSDDEKTLIGALLDRSPTVIDLEIALPARQRGDGAPRIDIAALEGPSDGHPTRVVFWEVKRINDARLRSMSKPKVVEQLRAYEDYVRSDPQLFEDAYRNACCILSQFHDIARAHWDSPRPLDRLVSEVANGSRLEVDAEPRLLIIEDQAPKANWHHHLSELTNRLGDRVHLVRPGQPLPRVPRRPA